MSGTNERSNTFKLGNVVLVVEWLYNMNLFIHMGKMTQLRQRNIECVGEKGQEAY